MSIRCGSAFCWQQGFFCFLERGMQEKSFFAGLYEETFPIRLFIEDNGEGIRESDIRRIFEKGYTGSNYHNGKYKSTGMGLYMADKIAGKLGHEISAESRYGEYTRFCVRLCGKKQVHTEKVL